MRDVSAAANDFLVVVVEKATPMVVGISKELADAFEGGSGLSFVDLMANRAGTMFVVAATQNESSARIMQFRIRDETSISDFLPDIEGLPEGIDRDQFREEFGGLGGKKTNSIVAEIHRRLASCSGLNAGE